MNPRNPFSARLALLLGLCVGTMLPVATAAEVVKSGGKVTGIQGIVIDGQQVEIRISDGNFYGLFPARYVSPITREAAARSAMDQVVEALNAGDGTPPGQVEGCGPGACLMFLPFADHTDPGSARVIRGQTDSAAGWTAREAAFNHKGFNTRSNDVSTYLIPLVK